MPIDSQRGSSGVLDGIRVLDLSRVLSGPSCGRVLLELGAEVIKVEPPEGDTTRRAFPKIGGAFGLFLSAERGQTTGLHRSLIT